ncbi:MAG TPA: GAF domain-containing protein, partial [Anaerolineae bacterium]|nr:GAF domain-containing protein [Anaerolineae bacterium]
MQELLQLLNKISDELNTDLNLEKMLQRVISLTVTHLNATGGSVILFDEKHRVSDYILQHGNLDETEAEAIVGRVLSEGFAGWVMRHGKGDIIADTA